ncbi:MAG: leucyl/phenylalanyl-tRNA--protein transferase [Bacteroidota bacterium]
MPIYQLSDDDIRFPDAIESEPDGLLAIGGTLSPERLVNAYASGIFPWYDRKPILWWSPNPRTILIPQDYKISKSLKRTIKSGKYEVRLDSAFSRVIDTCARISRSGETGTWITTEMKIAYKKLFVIGIAHSVETFHNNHLVGGLYGVSIGKAFFGESMFHTETDASKVAFAYLSSWLTARNFLFVDCQMHTDHLQSLGAIDIPKMDYLDLLAKAIKFPTLKGKWSGL